MSKRGAIIAGVIGLAIIAFGVMEGWTVKRSPQDKKIVEEAADSTSYYVFTDKDNGSTTAVAVGSIVVITLPEKSYPDSVTATTTEGILSLEHDAYNGNNVGSFTVPTTTAITIRALGAETSSSYLLQLHPYTTQP